jgi:hypothetical protein
MAARPTRSADGQLRVSMRIHQRMDLEALTTVAAVCVHLYGQDAHSPAALRATIRNHVSLHGVEDAGYRFGDATGPEGAELHELYNRLLPQVAAAYGFPPPTPDQYLSEDDE